MSEHRPGLPTIDVNEYGGKKEGVRQSMNRRLFMQLVVFDQTSGQDDAAPDALAFVRERRVPAVVYRDLNHPTGGAILTWGEDPSRFIELRPFFRGAQITLREGWTMLGRTYASGYEPNLEHWLLQRPIDNVMNEASPWHVWYPLRRTGAFARLPEEEQQEALREHAQIGLAYGQQGLGSDVRLACHGIDAADNEFVIGLIGKELHPLSHLVQSMRKTKQTSQYIEKMGPFFVGHVLGRSDRDR